jgi:predicted DCC family thiol-disulfide oxidoreductase YuxK
MTNGWTGGQYSVFRVVFGAYLCVHFLSLAPWGPELFSDRGMLPDASASPLAFAFPNVLTVFDSPAFVTSLLLLAAGASVLFAVGWYDRAAAVLLWYVWACLLGRNPLILNPGIPYVGWLLLAHAILPGAPYGSVAARRRPDPGGTWRMPALLFAGAWILMAMGYTYSGVTKLVSPSWLDGTAVARVLENPLARPGPLRAAILSLPDGLLRLGTWATLALELLFAPLALSRRLRPWIWTIALAMHVGLIALIDFADLSLGMVMLHLFTFDPAWVPAVKARTTETLFYDGGCGLCHNAVRFLLAEDRAPGGAFRFAPLGGETFQATVSRPADLPDSLVLVTDDGRILTRSRAVLHLGRRLGGLWRMMAGLVGLLPIALLDRAYDAVAHVRHRLFARPEEACPIAPRELRSRLLA